MLVNLEFDIDSDIGIVTSQVLEKTICKQKVM